MDNAGVGFESVPGVATRPPSAMPRDGARGRVAAVCATEACLASGYQGTELRFRPLMRLTSAGAGIEATS